MAASVASGLARPDAPAVGSTSATKGRLVGLLLHELRFGSSGYCDELSDVEGRSLRLHHSPCLCGCWILPWQDD